jgi:hypothetical protein
VVATHSPRAVAPAAVPSVAPVSLRGATLVTSCAVR